MCCISGQVVQQDFRQFSLYFGNVELLLQFVVNACDVILCEMAVFPK